MSDMTREEQCESDQREHGDKPCRQCHTCCLYYRQQESNADIEVSKLTRQLLDAKRNEERAVELRADVASLKAKLKQARAERNHENMRKLDAVNVASSMRTTMDAATAKLHSLEAAVRAVRVRNICDDHPDQPLTWLYALVPDGSEGGS